MVFIVAIITLALLGIMGLTASDTAHLNTLMAANGHDAKNAFFLADSGANAGHEYLERAIAAVNSTFYNDGTPATNASVWAGKKNFNPVDFPLVWHRQGASATHVRAGLMESGLIPGSAAQVGSGYGSAGTGAASGGTYSSYLIRAHRQGPRNSVAEVDLGWRHVHQ
jgi:Tfp pilus assembly protein PilX